MSLGIARKTLQVGIDVTVIAHEGLNMIGHSPQDGSTLLQVLTDWSLVRIDDVLLQLFHIICDACCAIGFLDFVLFATGIK